LNDSKVFELAASDIIALNWEAGEEEPGVTGAAGVVGAAGGVDDESFEGVPVVAATT